METIKKFLKRKFGIPLWVLIVWGILTIALLALCAGAGVTEAEAQESYTITVTKTLDPWTGLAPTISADWGGGVYSGPQLERPRYSWESGVVGGLNTYDFGGGLVYTYPPVTAVWPGTTTTYEVDVSSDY